MLEGRGRASCARGRRRRIAEAFATTPTPTSGAHAQPHPGVDGLGRGASRGEPRHRPRPMARVSDAQVATTLTAGRLAVTTGSLRLPVAPCTFRFPVGPTRAKVGGRPPVPQGPTLGTLIDAYLQDYQVRQFWSLGTARGRIAHLAAYFGRDARAAALTTYQMRQYQRARRAAGAAPGTINRETSALHRMLTLGVHWGWLKTVPGFSDRLRENPPRQGFFEHPEYLAVRAQLPAPWQGRS